MAEFAAVIRKLLCRQILRFQSHLEMMAHKVLREEAKDGTVSTLIKAWTINVVGP